MTEQRRISPEGETWEWDDETLQWVLVAPTPPTWEELRILTEGKRQVKG